MRQNHLREYLASTPFGSQVLYHIIGGHCNASVYVARLLTPSVKVSTAPYKNFPSRIGVDVAGDHILQLSFLEKKNGNVNIV